MNNKIKDKKDKKDKKDNKDKNEFRNKIDLLYLTNPTNLSFLKKDNYDTDVSKNKYNSKYTSLIITSTKKILNDEIISEKVNESFKMFVNNLIEHNNFMNRKRIVQQQYNDMDKEKKHKKYNPINIEQMDINIICKSDTKKIDLNAFVIKSKKKNNVIMPQKHNF